MQVTRMDAAESHTFPEIYFRETAATVLFMHVD
ncbi:hypothetical protein ARTHRO9AX_190103 [Arthrobacter sp. 9AX]|nr:hypothetical protein ARTHRO9AX_190103 [Arthrobacter sp. 9AX]